MKRISMHLLFLVLMGFMMFTSPQSGQAASEKIGVVNIGQVFDQYGKTQEFDQEFQSEGRLKQEERDAIVHQVRSLKDEQALLAQDARDQKQAEIDGRLKELDAFDATVRRDLGKRRNDAVKDVFEDIETVLKSYGERKGYDFIFNDRALLYQGKKFDVTADVIKELNNKYKKNG